MKLLIAFAAVLSSAALTVPTLAEVSEPDIAGARVLASSEQVGSELENG